MREILFRAKRTDNGEWAESRTILENISESDDKTYCIGARQSADLYFDAHDNIVAAETTGECLFYDCDPETIGQYTGLTDKNGKRIFEDDIGKSIDGIFLVRWNEEKCAFVMDFYDYPKEELYLEEMWDDAEIIGNIHDNPELVEGE